MSAGGWRLRLYRAAARLVRELFFSHLEPAGLARRGSEGTRAWFHGASAGEWEGLTPVVRAWIAASPGERVLLSVFSLSGAEKVARLKPLFDREAGSPIVDFAAASPREGEWRARLREARPRVFVTWKYDLWPDLLASLAELGIPLAVIGAAPRRSLRLARFFSALLGFPLPRLLLLPFSEPDRARLAREAGAPETVGPVVTDSRWERVHELARADHPRAREIWRRFGSSTRRAAVLAQVWPEDLQFWGESGGLGIAQGAFQLWIVPHRVDEPHVQRIRDLLHREGVAFVSLANVMAVDEPDCVLVDEIGLLNGLYAHMSWAYVGGGFGRGVHSVIEPAVHGLPIAVGDRRVDRFPEVAQLAGIGQLRVLSRGDELVDWLRDRVSAPTHPQAAEWRRAHEARDGGAAGIVAQIRSWLNSR